MNEQSSVAERVLLRSDAEGVAQLTLNQPAARNALSMELMEALDAELLAIDTDPAVKVVVIAGAVPAFCAGHDLRELRANPERAFYEATFPSLLAVDDAYRAPAKAGDRSRPWCGDCGGRQLWPRAISRSRPTQHASRRQA